MANFIRFQFGLISLMLAISWFVGVFRLGDQFYWTGVLVFFVNLGSFLFASQNDLGRYRNAIMGISCLLQALLLISQFRVALPLMYHIFGGGATVLIVLVLHSIEPPRYGAAWNALVAGVSGLLLVGWMPVMSFGMSSTPTGSFAHTWFRFSHGFYGSLPFGLSGIGGATSRAYSLNVERDKNGLYSFNGRGPYGLIARDHSWSEPILVSKRQYMDCIDGNGRPYFTKPYTDAHRFYQVSHCSKEKNDEVIALEGTTYKVVRMDGTEVRTLPYEVIDFGRGAPSAYGLQPHHVLSFRVRNRFGLIDRVGKELLPAISTTPLREVGSGAYLFTDASGVGLAAPGRGVILPPTFKEVSHAAIPTGEMTALADQNGQNLSIPYDGVYWVKTKDDAWGLYATNQNVWLIESGKLIYEGVPFDSPVFISREALSGFKMENGQWLFMERPIREFLGEYIYDRTSQRFAPPKTWLSRR